MGIKIVGGVMGDFKKGIVAPSDFEIELSDVKAYSFDTLVEIYDGNQKSNLLARLGLREDTPDEAVRDALIKLYPLKDKDLPSQENAIKSSKLSEYLTTAANLSTIVSTLVGFFNK